LGSARNDGDVGLWSQFRSSGSLGRRSGLYRYDSGEWCVLCAVCECAVCGVVCVSVLCVCVCVYACLESNCPWVVVGLGGWGVGGLG